jgi:hypothetical protein
MAERSLPGTSGAGACSRLFVRFAGSPMLHCIFFLATFSLVIPIGLKALDDDLPHRRQPPRLYSR